MSKRQPDLSSRHGRPYDSSRSIRWLLAPVLAVGYYLLLSFLDQPDTKYIVFAVSSFIAGSLLLSRLRSVELALPAWVILCVFIAGYYAKFIWILLFSDTVLVSLPMAVQVSANHGSLVAALGVATLAFLTFAIAAWVMFGRRWMRRPFATADDMDSARSLIASNKFARANLMLVPIAILISGVSGYLMYRYGIAVMGVPGERLPFRLGGLIFYTRLLFVPTLLLVSVWYALGAHRLPQLVLSVGLLLANGLLDMFLRASRGALALNLVTFVFLLIIWSNRIRIWHVVIFVLGFASVAMLHPVMTEYRNLRMTGASNIVDSLLVSLMTVARELSIWDLLRDGIGAIVMRVVGIDALIPIFGLDVQPLRAGAWDVLRSAGGVAGYYTMDVLAYPSDARTSFAPSLVGWFYLLGGTTSVIFGVAGFTLITLGCWRVLRAMRLTIAPVAQATFLTVLLGAATDGVLDQMGWTVAAAVGSIAAAEIFASFALRAPLSFRYRRRSGLEPVRQR